MKKNILLLMFIQLFIYLGFGMIIPIMPEIINQLNVNIIHLGSLLAVHSLISFVTAPMWGVMSDQYGRKRLIVIGLLGYAFSFTLFGLTITNLTGLYVARIMSGFFSSALYTATISYVADHTTYENRTKYMGFLGISIGLGFILGPSIGGLLSVFGLAVPSWLRPAWATRKRLYATTSMPGPRMAAAIQSGASNCPSSASVAHLKP